MATGFSAKEPKRKEKKVPDDLKGVSKIVHEWRKEKKGDLASMDRNPISWKRRVFYEYDSIGRKYPR